MSLSQSARSQYHTRQKNRLILCLSAAIAAHGLLLAGWSLEQRENQQPQKDPIEVGFVYLNSTDNNAENPEASRQAQVNSTAGGTRNPDLPSSAGRSVQSTAARFAPSRSISPSAPASAQSTPLQAASQPAAAAPPSAVEPAPLPPSPPAPPAPSPPQPTAIQRRIVRPASPTPEGSPARPESTQTLPRQTASPPRPATLPAAPVAPSDNPQSGQGLDGQINPDRTATGTASIDAAANEDWGAYVSTLNRTIDQNWQRITVSATRQAKVQFELDRQGRLIHLNLVQSSGDSATDAAALQAVQLAAPFTPFPNQTTESRLRLNFTFTYYPPGAFPTTQSPN